MKSKGAPKTNFIITSQRSSIYSHKTSDIPIVTDQDADTMDSDKLIEINESDNTLSSSTSLAQSSTSCSGYEIHDNENFNDKENTSTTITAVTATTATSDLLTKSSSISSFKRDLARGPEQARAFILLGPYQPVTISPTINPWLPSSFYNFNSVLGSTWTHPVKLQKNDDFVLRQVFIYAL